MSKIALSFKILNFLLDENIHKTKEISEKIEIPQSVVRWHINELIEAGIYIQSSTGRNGGYMLNKKCCVNSIHKLMCSE